MRQCGKPQEERDEDKDEAKDPLKVRVQARPFSPASRIDGELLGERRRADTLEGLGRFELAQKLKAFVENPANLREALAPAPHDGQANQARRRRRDDGQPAIELA